MIPIQTKLLCLTAEDIFLFIYKSLQTFQMRTAVGKHFFHFQIKAASKNSFLFLCQKLKKQIGIEARQSRRFFLLGNV